MEPKVLLQKLIFFTLWFIVYYNICFLILVPEIYSIPVYLIYLLLFYLFTFVDTLIRPISEKGEVDKYTLILLVLFALSPFLLIFAYWENKFIIAQYVMFWDNLMISYVGLFLYIIAGIIAIMVRIQLGRQGSGFLVIEDKHELVMSGIYRYIRHPLYSANLLGVFGFGLVFRSLIMTSLTLFAYFLVFNHRLEYEEQILEQEFGEEYTEYKKRTKRLIPFIY